MLRARLCTHNHYHISPTLASLNSYRFFPSLLKKQKKEWANYYF